MEYDIYKLTAPPTNEELEEVEKQQDEKELAIEWNSYVD